MSFMPNIARFLRSICGSVCGAHVLATTDLARLVGERDGSDLL